MKSNEEAASKLGYERIPYVPNPCSTENESSRAIRSKSFASCINKGTWSKKKNSVNIVGCSLFVIKSTSNINICS